MKSVQKETRSPWVSLSPSGGPRLARMFCFPFAGGGATAYHRWSKRVLVGIEVARIQLPGREARLREPLYTRLDSLVDTLAEELIPWVDGPFVLYGHSMGALLAFELARKLRKGYRLLPEHLFVGGYRGPHLP